MRVTDGNQIKLLRNGAEYFPALISAILAARRVVHVQTYIYALDETGVLVGNALMQVARNGVEVNVLLDGFGSKDLPKSYVNTLEQAGVQVMFYRPKISPWTLKTRRLRRLHRKVAVIDDQVGFVGGINIIDDQHVSNQTPPRVDYALQITGPVLMDMVETVNQLWRSMAWLNLQRVKQHRDDVKQLAAIHEATAGMKAAYVIRNNVLHRRDIEAAYLDAINQATSEILIANAYFLPGKRFRNALVAAAKRGVSVKLLLQGRKEYFLMFATHAFYPYFLRAGVEVYEYRKSFMHSKVAVIDNNWATVGSSNIDPFSLLLSLEANIVVLDAQFAAELKQEIVTSIQHAYCITPETWAHESRVKRLLSWVAYGLVKFFLGIIGYPND